MSLGPRFIRGGKRRRDTVSPRRILLQAAIVTAVVVLIGYGALSIYGGAPWNSYKTIYVNVPDTGNLRPHDPVKIGGVHVGQVISIGVTQNGDARLNLQINSGTKLPTGTGFAIRANGLLGSRYVQLIPGTGTKQLSADATLTGGVDSLSYGVPEALNVFDASTRGALGTMINGLGEGLLGRGTGLNRTIHQISVYSTPARQIFQSLVGPGQLQALIPSLETLLSPLNAARTTIGDGLEPAAHALQPLVTQRSAVQATLSEAPGTLTAATTAFVNGNRLLDAANGLAVEAQKVLPEAPAGLRQTTLLLSGSNTALARAKTLLVQVKPAVPAVLAVTKAVKPVLSPATNVLNRAIPITNTIAPYGCGVINAAAVIRSMTGFGGNEAGGPGGPPMAFRLEVILAPPTEILGTKDYTGLVKRVGYTAPCANLSTTYPTFTNVSGKTGGS